MTAAPINTLVDYATGVTYLVLADNNSSDGRIIQVRYEEVTIRPDAILVEVPSLTAALTLLIFSMYCQSDGRNFLGPHFLKISIAAAHILDQMQIP